MKASELRIGNIVLEGSGSEVDEFTIAAVNSLTNTVIDTDDNISSIDYLKPIPLTEEWLGKLGFDRSGDHAWVHKGEYEVFTINDDLKVGRQCIYDRASLKYVHQLQNLYFALTGEELKLYEMRMGK